MEIQCSCSHGPLTQDQAAQGLPVLLNTKAKKYWLSPFFLHPYLSGDNLKQVSTQDIYNCNSVFLLPVSSQKEMCSLDREGQVFSIWQTTPDS